MENQHFALESEKLTLPEAELKAKKLVNKLIELRNKESYYQHLDQRTNAMCWESRNHGLELAIDVAKRSLLDDWSGGYEPYDLGASS